MSHAFEANILDVKNAPIFESEFTFIKFYFASPKKVGLVKALWHLWFTSEESTITGLVVRSETDDNENKNKN